MSHYRELSLTLAMINEDVANCNYSTLKLSNTLTVSHSLPTTSVLSVASLKKYPVAVYVIMQNPRNSGRFSLVTEMGWSSRLPLESTKMQSLKE